jgi:pyruvate dehydrogenase E2 component (dihydrolipoamide acetyltransferase)
MPQLGLEVHEGTVVAVLVELGAAVMEGQAVVELATDKADTTIDAPRAGYVSAIAVTVGDAVTTGATLLCIADDPGESSRLPDSAPEPAVAHPVKVAPVARRAAEELGISLEALAGTGPGGRIVLDDVRRAAAAAVSPPESSGSGAEPVSARRRRIAERMVASQREIPQYRLERDIDASHLGSAKVELSEHATGRITVNDLLVQAIGEMVVRHPSMAVTYVDGDGDQPCLRHRAVVDVGIAVATDRGLLVPVVRHVDERSLVEIAAERSRLVHAARTATLDLREMGEATITLSSLSAYGVDRFTAMVNPGESSILAVGRTIDRLVPREGGIAVVPMMTVTLSLDHRAVDGAVGAEALGTLAELLEGAMAWRV